MTGSSKERPEVPDTCMERKRKSVPQHRTVERMKSPRRLGEHGEIEGWSTAMFVMKEMISEFGGLAW